MNSPLQLKEHRFTQLSVEAIADGAPGNGVDVRTTCALAQNSADKLLWRATMTVEFGPLESATHCPYQGKAEIIGTFTVAENWKKAGKDEELVSVNGASILYGAIREMVLLVTSRSSHGPLMIPTLSFTQQSRQVVVEPKTDAAASSKAVATAPMSGPTKKSEAVIPRRARVTHKDEV